MTKRKNPFLMTRKAPEKTFTERELIKYGIQEEVADGFDSKRPADFLINRKTVVVERIPIDEYVESFASKVGLNNELKGIVTKSQMDDYIAAHSAQPGFVDLTELPDTALEMEKLAKRVDDIWESIPTELKGSLSKEQFLAQLTEEKLQEYISSQVSSQLQKESEVKE